MAVDQSLSNEIDAAIEESQKDDANQQAEPEDSGQSDSRSEGEDWDDSELDGEEDSLDDTDGDDEEEPSDEDDSEESGEEDEKPPAISDAAITRAVRAGLSLEDAREWPSEASLNRVVSEIEAVKKATKVSETPKEETKSEPVDPLADLPKLDPEVYGEEAIQTFDRLTEVIRSQQKAIEQFRTQQEETAKAAADASAKEAEQWFDAQVEKLGSDFADALGAGRYSELPQGSPQQAKREALANQVAVLVAGYQQIGQEVPSRDEIFDTAAKLVLADEYGKLNEKQLAKDLKDRSSQHINRAGGRQAKTKQSPDEAVAAELDEKFYS